MNSKKLLILGAIALVAIAGGVWLASERSSSSLEVATALYPDLKKKLNDTSAVRVFSAGDKLAVEIVRKGDNWAVAQRNDYPADEAKLRKLLLGLADAEIREEKTSNPDNYSSLGVEDLSDESATGSRVEIEGVDPQVNLIVGKEGPGLDSRYVRRAGEAKSWLIAADIDAPSEPQEWLERSILDVTADRMQSATITTKGAKPYSAVKNSRADANFTIENLPKGKKLSFAAAPNSLATALAGLTLSDVQPANDFTDKPQAQATYRTFDGLIVELEGWSREDKHFIAARASYDASLAERFKIPSEEKSAEDNHGSEDDGDKEGTEATSDAAEAEKKPETPKQDIAAEAKTLNDKLAGWVYEIPGYKYEAVFKPLSEMLEN